MTVNEWRSKHRRCEFCTYLRYSAAFGFMCVAKQKLIDSALPRPVCKLFKLKEV